MLIKQEPDDFIVEEIAPDGEVLEAGAKHSFAGGEGALVFVLEKRNWDTIGAVKELAKRLRISQRRIGFAGTKDRRAVTTQRCSAKGIKREQAEGVKIKDITISPIGYGDEVKLGDLAGNRFTVVVRDVDPDTPLPSTIPNHFGEQRFGATRPMTHLVGKAIVEEDVKRAVEAYLFKWFDTEPPEDRRARQRLEKEGDYAEALDYYPKRLTYERTLLGHLAQKPGDYAGALRKLPRKLLLMFVHAYQSDLFNRVLDRRRPMGFEPLEGDILENGVPTGPLYGYDMELAGGKQGEIERAVLEDEWLELKQFRLHRMPELSSKGMRRPMLVKPEGFEVLKKGGDWVRIRFSLPKGCYATTVLGEMFRSQ